MSSSLYLLLLILSIFLNLGPVLSKKKDAEADVTSSKSSSVAALCVAIRDEHLDVHEWVSYHVSVVGVQRIYMYDFRSDPPLSSLIKPFIQNGTVVYSFRSGFPKRYKYDQAYAYT